VNNLVVLLKDVMHQKLMRLLTMYWALTLWQVMLW